MLSFLSQINYFAVLVSSIIFFVIGYIWYCPLFGNLWAKELEQVGITIKEPNQNEMFSKMLIAFIEKFIVSFAIAGLIAFTKSTDFSTAIVIGILTALIAMIKPISLYTWESRSLKLILIDFGYYLISFTTISIIVSLWH